RPSLPGAYATVLWSRSIRSTPSEVQLNPQQKNLAHTLPHPPGIVRPGRHHESMTATILPLPTGLPDDALEIELLTLAGQLAAAECRFLQLLAEFDDRRGWAIDGIHSCAHWLSWRAGM